MNVSLNPIDWEKPLIWWQQNGNWFHCSIISLNILESDLTADQKKHNQRIAILVDGAGPSAGTHQVRYVDENGNMGEKGRYIFNIADVKTIAVPVGDIDNPDVVNNLGEF